MSRKRILMCGPPEHYGVKYEINPWMKKSNQPDRARVEMQWRSLKDALERSGVWVSLVGQLPNFPDMVFSANAGIFNRNKNTVLLSRFRYPERQGETPAFRDWFLSQGFNFKTLPSGIFFEGEGDALVFKDKLICGYGFRSDEAGGVLAAEFMGLEPITFRLIDPHFYHFDTCFCPISEKNLIMYYPPAFDSASCYIIETLGNIIRVSQKDALGFVCNAVVLDSKLIATQVSLELKIELKKHGVETEGVNLSEFIKAGGAAKCLTLFI